MAPDEWTYLAVLLAAIPTGFAFKTAVPRVKQVGAAAVGLGLTLLTCGPHVLHSLVTILVTWGIMKAQPRSCHFLALGWTFSYLLFFRTVTAFGLPAPTPFTNAIQLLLTLKLVSLASEVQEFNRARREEVTGAFAKTPAVGLLLGVPTLPEILSYSYCYVGIMTDAGRGAAARGAHAARDPELQLLLRGHHDRPLLPVPHVPGLAVAASRGLRAHLAAPAAAGPAGPALRPPLPPVVPLLPPGLRAGGGLLRPLLRLPALLHDPRLLHLPHALLRGLDRGRVRLHRGRLRGLPRWGQGQGRGRPDRRMPSPRQSGAGRGRGVRLRDDPEHQLPRHRLLRPRAGRDALLEHDGAVVAGPVHLQERSGPLLRAAERVDHAAQRLLARHPPRLLPELPDHPAVPGGGGDPGVRAAGPAGARGPAGLGLGALVPEDAGLRLHVHGLRAAVPGGHGALLGLRGLLHPPAGPGPAGPGAGPGRGAGPPGKPPPAPGKVPRRVRGPGPPPASPPRPPGDGRGVPPPRDCDSRQLLGRDPHAVEAAGAPQPPGI
ncbi:lysophospholipid acyltransferase 7 isoform X1 [Tachyglossus aculeatus]|uniref:lysophospholipid acyltransferase 7 isoform X1 n=1 Tax=Tachyglossus aculeatus TaxID=9261 RepID=UPI0018F453DD|nr:lysophospholipid acyltransferase 7 isoform X1 [Tachyglossus aculeatus]